MIKYYIRTVHKLPPSKWIMNRKEDILPILDEMRAKMPTNRFLSRDDFFNSVDIVEFETDEIPNWRDIFKEFKNWDWIDLGSFYK